MSRYDIQQVNLNNVNQPGFKGYLVDRGVEVNSDGSDGTLYQTAHHVIRRKPVADLTSYSLKAILTALNGGTDFPVLALDGTHGLIMYGAQQAANAAGFAAGSVHIARTALRGVIYLAGIRWSEGQRAEAMLKALLISPDGTTQAVTEVTAQALPAQPVPDFGFTLAALTLAGVAVPRVKSFELSIDPHFEFEHTYGLPEPTGVYGAPTSGKLEITARADVADMDVGAGTGAASAVFQRFANGGGLGSDTATLTLNAAWANEESFGGENNQSMSRPLLVRTAFSGSTKPLAWAVA